MALGAVIGFCLGVVVVVFAVLVATGAIPLLEPKPPTVCRVIDCRGCMAQDEHVRTGVLVEVIDGKMYDGNWRKHEYALIRMDDTGELDRQPMGRRFIAEDGAWEFRF